jgi:hypothetical protein
MLINAEYNSKTKSIKVIDTDFIDIVKNRGDGGGSNSILDGVVRIYEKRKLNVALNIIRFLRIDKETGYTIPDTIEYFKYKSAYNTHLACAIFNKYKEDIDKYLILL